MTPEKKLKWIKSEFLAQNSFGGLVVIPELSIDIYLCSGKGNIIELSHLRLGGGWQEEWKDLEQFPTNWK